MILGKLKGLWRRYNTYKLRQYIVNTKHDVNDVSKDVFDARKYGFSLSESSLFKLNKENINNYITTWESYQPRTENNPYFLIGDDKYVFSMVFGKYIEVPKTYALIQNGKVIPLTNELPDPDGVYDLLVRLNGGVIKDRSGCDGFNVYVFKTSGNTLVMNEKEVTKDELSKIIKEFRNGIVQNRLEQGDFENAIFDKSINTIRLVTMRKPGEIRHEAVAALQRIGNEKSSPVDNFNQGGGSALIDIETGEIGSMTCMQSVDENGNRIFYDNHPESGAKIKGSVIPGWDNIKNTILDITEKLPFFNYVAWDIVLKNDGIALIEINMKSSLNVFQIHRGMRNEILGEKYRQNGYIKD